MKKGYKKYLIPRVSTPIKAGKVTPRRDFILYGGVVIEPQVVSYQVVKGWDVCITTIQPPNNPISKQPHFHKHLIIAKL